MKMNFENNTRLLLDDVSKYFGRKCILKNISLSLSPGSITAVIGKNGSGKTSLLNIISGYWNTSTGRRVTVGDLATRMDYLFQSRFMDMHLSISSNLQIIAQMKRLSGKSYIESIEEKLNNIFNTVFPRAVKVSSLSRGQLRMLEFCVAVTTESKFLILDEPTTHLDIRAKEKCIAWLADRLEDRSLMTVLSTHDSHEFELCTHYLFLDRCRISERGTISNQPYSTVFKNNSGEACFGS